jgi:hypothetical protein
MRLLVKCVMILLCGLFGIATGIGVLLPNWRATLCGLVGWMVCMAGIYTVDNHWEDEDDQCH